MIYIGIFVIISIASSSSLRKTANETYEISKPNIVFVSVGEETELKKALYEMLQNSARLHVASDVLKAKEDIVSQKADYLIVIGEDALDRMKKGQPAAEVFYEPGNPAGILADIETDRLFRYIDAYERTYGRVDFQAIQEAVQESIAVKIESENVDAMSRTAYFKQYMKFFHYVFISVSLFVISPLLMKLNRGELRTRCSVSSLRPSEYFMQLALAVTVLTTLFIIVFVVFGLAIVEFHVDSGTLFLLITDIFIFGLSMMTFVVLISNLPVGVRVISSFANVFSIVVAFTTGIFIPTEFLPEAVINISKFFPAYYSVYITTGENLSMGSILFHLGVQILFAAVFSLGAVYLGKSRTKSVLNTENPEAANPA